MIRTALETLLVLGFGVALGLGANALDEDGLDLTRDYFPKGPISKQGPISQQGPANQRGPASQQQGPADEVASDKIGAGATPANSAPSTGGIVQPVSAEIESPPEPLPTEPGDGSGSAPAPVSTLDPALVERLAAKGLVGIDFALASAAWNDELRPLGAILFIDARDDDHYQAGHIPGAWQLDHYHPDRHLAEILPLLPGTMQIVVYCTGGDCEDSESTALLLQQFGADPTTIRIYAGGISEWTERSMPLELGERDSGRLKDIESP